MDYIIKYYEKINAVLKRLFDEQGENMQKAAEKIVDTVTDSDDNIIYIFGCTHAGIIAQEAFYRTGGLAVINPIFPPGLMCDITPSTLTSKIERIDGYGAIIADEYNIKKGDLLIIHSVSGRNAVPVDMAIRARELGAYIIGITSLEYSKASKSRSTSGKNLYEVVDLVIDNCGETGDAAIEIDGFVQKTSPTSTVTGAAIINAVTAQAAGIFIDRGITPPVFISANIDGGDEKNAVLMKRYRNRIKYL
ncbi:MAG: SIS domain-containing protein [Oscillospiraceae bacterium]|nr:SIS domain-containing protein [Oscillospiraceae bacterium]